MAPELRVPSRSKRTNDAYETGGQVFPFSETYFDTVMAARPLASVAALPVYAGSDLQVHSRKVEDVTFQVFLAKYYDYALLVDTLSAVGKLGRFRSALDLGSGPAIQARVLKLTGWTERCAASDVYDARPRCSDRRLRRFGRLLWFLYRGYRAQQWLPTAIRDAVPRLRRMNNAFPIGVSTFGYRPDERAYGAWLRRGSSLDAYHVGDILEHRGQYDLITSFMALEYFDFDRLVAKVGEWLDPGGIFAFLVAYWWYPVNNTLLYGRFPYLLQQLSTEKVLEYFARVHPEIDPEGVTRRLLYSDRDRPTVADYETLALKHRLAPVCAIRLHPDPVRNERAVMGPMAIHALPEWRLETVLANARRLNPTLTLSDLMTSHVLMVFEKQ